MRSLKSVFGVIAALVPVLYCGGLLYYFLDLSGSVEEAQTNGLGPTVLGLAAVGLLFCIPLIAKLFRIFAEARLPGPGGRGGTRASTRSSEDAFDADATLARYMARQSTEAASGSPAAPPAHEGGGRAPRSSFGRRSDGSDNRER